MLQVTVNIADINDNAPEFVYDSDSIVKDQYLVAIPATTSVGASIFRIEANDQDSDAYGHVMFELLGDDLAKEYFEVDSDSGLVKTKNSFIGAELDADQGDLPFELIVLARDNPNDLDNSLTQKTMLVVSVRDLSPLSRL